MDLISCKSSINLGSVQPNASLTLKQQSHFRYSSAGSPPSITPKTNHQNPKPTLWIIVHEDPA